MKRGDVDLADFGKELALGAPTAAIYAAGANWVMRRAGLSYAARAGVSAVAGGLIGGGLAYAGAKKIGTTIAVTGVAAGILYGVAEVGTRMFLGSPDSRTALPASTTTTTPTTTTTGTPQALTLGAPRGAAGIPTGIPMAVRRTV